MSETELDEERLNQVLQHAVQGVLYLASADGEEVPVDVRLEAGFYPAIEALIESYDASPHSESAPKLREQAVASFRQAAELAPEKAWLWLQIAWTLFAFESAPYDLIAAGEALDKALALAPNNPVLHLAAAWLAQHEAEATGHFANEVEQRVCEGLARGIGWMLEGLEDIDLKFRDFFGTYFPTPGGSAAFGRALQVFERFVPDRLRFAYSFICAWTLGDPELEIQWLKEALCWETDDVTALAAAHLRLGIYCDSSAPPGERQQRFLHSGQLLINRTDEDRRLAARYGHTNNCEFDWLVFAPLPAHGSQLDPDSNALEFLRMGRELYDRAFGDRTARPFALQLAEACTAAGEWALEKGDIEVARDYLLAARRYERSAVAVSPDPGWKRMFDEANAWRKPLAGASRTLFMNDGDWEAAERENTLLLEIAPCDQEALRWKLEFERTRHVNQQRRAEELQLSRMNAQAQALLELWGKALDELSALREQMKDLNKLRLREGEEFDDFMSRLHEIVQNATQISPSAWQRAQRRLQSALGEAVFGALTPNSQHFLTTAEVFFTASQGVPEIDLALIVVEYAKAVETELRERFVHPFSLYLERRPWRKALELRSGSVPYRGPGTWTVSLDSLTLGGVAQVLDVTLEDSGNSALRNDILKYFPDAARARSCTNALLAFVDYRNDAAHSERLDRPSLEAVHRLLFEGNLLRRLAEIGSEADKA